MMIRICNRYNRHIFCTCLSLVSALYLLCLPTYGTNAPPRAPDKFLYEISVNNGSNDKDNLAITETPVINSPVCNGASSISGTINEADGTIIAVYKNEAFIGFTTVSANAWTLTGISTTLISGNSITAYARASGKEVSVRSTAVTVSTPVTATIIGSTETCQNSPEPIITFTGFYGIPPFTFMYSINGKPPVSVTSITGNSAIVTAPTHSPDTITYTLLSVTEASISACSNIAEGKAVITVRTNVGITSVTAESSPICSTATTTLTAHGVTGSNAQITWWTGAGGTGTRLGTGPILNNAAPGTYYANVTGDCGISAEASVIVEHIVLNPGSINTNGGNYCVGGNARIGGTSPPYGGASGGIKPYTYQWETSYNPGRGCNPTPSVASGKNDTTSYDPPEFTLPGTYCYRRKVTDACGTIAYTNHAQFNVYPDPVPQTIVPNPISESVCAGTDVSAIFEGGTGGITSLVRDAYTITLPVIGPMDYTPGSAISTAGYAEGAIISMMTRRIHPPGVNGCQSPYNLHQWTVRKTPGIYNMTGGGSYCSGGSGVDVGLDGSEGNTIYQLYRDGVTTGVPLAGTGSSLSFGRQTIPGIYSVRARNTATLCIQNMTGAIPITVSPLSIPKITGAPLVCENTTNQVYTTENGMTGYIWTISSGGTITAGPGTHEVTVTWNTVGNQTLTVSYINGDGCLAENPSTILVKVSPLPVTSPIYHN